MAKKIHFVQYWGITTLVLLILGVIFVNSLYKGGYDCTWISYSSNNLVIKSTGYGRRDNNFKYLGDTNCYVQFTNACPSDQLLFYFDTCAARNITVSVDYIDQNGEVLEKKAVGEWEKDTNYAKVDIESGDYSAYRISVPANFTLQKVYYATRNDFTKNREAVLYIIVFLIAATSSVILVALKITRKYIRKFYRLVKQKIAWLRNNPEKAAKCVSIFAAMLLFACFLVYLSSMIGFCSFSIKMVVFVYLLLMLVMVVMGYRRIFNGKVEIFGFLTILIVGSMLSFLEPSNVGVSWDDEIHYRNAVQLSHVLEGRISAADSMIIEDYASVALDKRNYIEEDQNNYNEFLDVLESSHYYAEMKDFLSINKVIAYIPSALGLTLARGLGFPYHIVLIAGRWMNVWMLAVLAYLSMKNLKTGKAIVLFIVLLPTNIFMAANYSYDTWLTGWTIYGLSVFLGEWQQPQKKFDMWKAWLIGGAMFLAMLPKLIYFPLTLITLFMPVDKFKNKKECWMYRCIILAATVMPLVMTYMSTLAGDQLGQGDTRGGGQVNATEQLQLTLSKPLYVLKVHLEFLKNYLNPWKEGREYIVKMAYVGYAPVDYRIILSVITIGAFASREEKEERFPWWTKAGVILEYVVIGFMAAFSLYITFTPVGLNTVNGCQGRYILPTLFPLLYVLSRFSGKTRIKNYLGEIYLNIFPVVFLVVVTTYGFWKGCLALY